MKHKLQTELISLPMGGTSSIPGVFAWCQGLPLTLFHAVSSGPLTCLQLIAYRTSDEVSLPALIRVCETLSKQTGARDSPYQLDDLRSCKEEAPVLNYSGLPLAKGQYKASIYISTRK